MNTRPFTLKQQARLFRVCDVVREYMGLRDLCVMYRYGGDTEYIADSKCFQNGWRTEITFFDKFFEFPFETQLEIIVHEHIHASMQPFDQAVYHVVHRELPRPNRKDAYHRIDQAREVSVDHLTLPMLRLLRPFINKVL